MTGPKPTKGKKPTTKQYSPADSAKKYFKEMEAGDRLSVDLRFRGDTAGARRAKERADLNAEKALTFRAEAIKKAKAKAKPKPQGRGKGR